MVGLCAARSISELVTHFCIYNLYWFGLLERRLNNHLRRDAQFEPNVHFWETILFNGRDSLLVAFECVFRQRDYTDSVISGTTGMTIFSTTSNSSSDGQTVGEGG